MVDGNIISLTLAYFAVPRNENLQLSNFAKLQNNLKPYTTKANKLPDLDSKKPFTNTEAKTAKSSFTLSSLISNPTILARVEANPNLRAAILSNPFLAELISSNSGLLSAIIKSPGLLASLTSSPDILSAIKDNPSILSEIIKNPTLSIESILERLTKKLETISSPKTKNNSPQVPRPLDKSTIAAERARPATGALLSGVKAVGAESLEIQKQQSSQVLEAKTLQTKVPIRALTIQASKPMTYFDVRLLAINPSLLALLGAAAFTANRGKIISVSGNLKDVEIDLETQSESQVDALQESDQVGGIGEIEQIHSISEASIMNLNLQ